MFDGSKIRIAIIILTLNQRDKTIQCLSSLYATGEEPLLQILLWDNGSQDDTVIVVKEAFPEVLCYYHPSNLGVAAGRNAGAALAIKTFDPTHLLFLDNDMLFEPGFVSALLNPFLQDNSIGQTQAKLRFMHDRARLNDGGGAKIDFVRWQVIPVGYGEADRGQYDEVAPCIACGGAMMVRTDVFLQLGGFDPTFGPFGPEDLDFSLRLAQSGYRALYVPKAMAYHEVSHTFGSEYGEDYARHKSRHWWVFMRRHASLGEQIAFMLLGAPSLVVRLLIREGRRGNLAALRGILRGLIDSWTLRVTSKGAGRPPKIP